MEVVGGSSQRVLRGNVYKERSNVHLEGVGS